MTVGRGRREIPEDARSRAGANAGDGGVGASKSFVISASIRPPYVRLEVEATGGSSTAGLRGAKFKVV